MSVTVKIVLLVVAALLILSLASGVVFGCGSTGSSYTEEPATIIFR